ncbi:MAG: acyltransferase [Bacteroidales bacterium]|nr:acyltransferase [Bacteroidales bacterium]
MMAEAPKREHWIDCLKAICIICVYIAHCESFYYEGESIASFLVAPFYVNAFFFISGYLLFKKQFNNNRIENYTFKREYRQDLCNILFRLVIPTIIFSAIIYLPKNNGIFDLRNFILNVLGGTSLWFTSALAVSQLVIFTLLLSRRTNIWFYVVFTFLLLLGTFCLGDVRSKAAEEYFPWYWQTGLIYTFLMILGGVYSRYERRINNAMNKPLTLMAAFGILATIMMFAWNGTTMLCLGLSGKGNILGYSTIITSILLLIYIAKAIPKNRFTDFIGKQSIVFYFLSGAVPTTLLPLIKKIPLDNSCIICTAYITLSLIASYIATYMVTRYVPFILDFRNLYRSNK